MKTRRNWTIAGLTVLLGCSGCKTVVRENIISSINTGIGVTVAQSPQTELYEVKVGYIRSQFYSVPTGKVVENENEDDGSKATTTKTVGGTNLVVEGERKDMRSNRADITPQVVSGIRLESGIEQLLVGLNVSESFAVGETAVMSPAAVAMYVADARTKEAAEAASQAAGAASGLSRLKTNSSTASIETMDGIISYLQNLPQGDYPKAKEIVDELQEVRSLVPHGVLRNYSWNTVNQVVKIDDYNAPAGYRGFKQYYDTLEESAKLLGSITATSFRINNLQFIDHGGAQAGITTAQIIQVSRDLEIQRELLDQLSEAFNQHSAVIQALDYFSSLVKS